MAEYIEREEIRRAYEKLTRSYVNGNSYIADWRFDEMIEKLPAADVAPVVHSRWAHFGGDEWGCPVCGFVITTEGSWDKPTKKYCENCGTKMDGGADND